MTEITEKFVSDFHNLEGTTIAEKRKHLFELFHKNAHFKDNPPLLENVRSRLIARTHLERIFRVEFLIYYRCVDELTTEFFKGDEIIINKINKQKWFFETAFHDFGAQFVSEFMPSLSYSLRLKVLKKLATLLEETQADTLFDALHQRYGVFIATNILTSCSSSRIEQTLRNHPVKLWTSQLKLLYERNPDLLYIYFDERVKHEGNTKFLNNDPIFKFIAGKNPEMFCSLQEKYKFEYVQLGKRTTKKLVKRNKDRIVAQPHLYVKNLNSARLVRCLGSDFKQVYLKVFPRTRNEATWYWSDAAKLLKHYTKNGRFSMFRCAFDQIFHKKLESSPDMIDENLLAMMVDGDERERWAKIRMEQEKSDLFLKYFRAPNCIDALKNKYMGERRNEAVSWMTESCLINRDLEALLIVCKLLCDPFKNEDKGVHATFLQTLTTQKYQFVFNNLTETHWSYIRKIISRREFAADSEFDTTAILFKYLEFLHTNGSSLEEAIKTLVQRSNWSNHLEVLLDNKAGKPILVDLIKLAPELIPESDTIENADASLLSACKKYNSRNSADKISIFECPRLLESMKNALGDEDLVPDYELAPLVAWIICRKDFNEQVEELTDLYWENFQRMSASDCVNWFLRNRPAIIAANIEKIVSVASARCYSWDLRRIWRTIKCYSHLKMDELLISYCLTKLKTTDFSDKKELIEPLSIVMTPEDFKQMAESYKPTVHVVDLTNDEANQLFYFQRYLLKSCTNINAPELLLPLILDFCNGDYVASCVSPLYSCFYKVSENRIQPFLDKLCSTGAVSVKKHGFYFACVVLKEAGVLNALKNCHLNQALAMAYQHMVKNPSELSWGVFKTKLVKMDKNDHFTNLLLINTPAPKQYKTRCFQAVVEIFRQQNNRFTKVLLDKVQKETVGQLTTQFFESIQDDFLTVEKCDVIFSYYLLCCREEAKFNVILRALRVFKEKHWSFRTYECREKLCNFVNTFFTVYMEWDNVDDSLISNFMSGFQEIFDPAEAFEETVMISLMQFKQKQDAEFCKAVICLTNRFVDTYGSLVLSTFAEYLNKLLPKFCKNIYAFYYSLFRLSQDVNNILLIVYLLPNTPPELEESAKPYYDLLRSLEGVENETVQLHLQYFEKS